MQSTPDVLCAARGLCSAELGAHAYMLDAVVGCISARLSCFVTWFWWSAAQGFLQYTAGTKQLTRIQALEGLCLIHSIALDLTSHHACLAGVLMTQAAQGSALVSCHPGSMPPHKPLSHLAAVEINSRPFCLGGRHADGAPSTWQSAGPGLPGHQHGAGSTQAGSWPSSQRAQGTGAGAPAVT